MRAPHEARRNRIINFAGAGVGGPNTAWAVSAMAASKAAVVELTEVLAKDPGFASIRINAIAPGSVPTPGVERLLRAGPERLGADFYAQTAKEYAEGDSSAGKVVELVRWLISDAAAGVTGRCIPCTCGINSMLNSNPLNPRDRFGSASRLKSATLAQPSAPSAIAGIDGSPRCT